MPFIVDVVRITSFFDAFRHLTSFHSGIKHILLVFSYWDLINLEVVYNQDFVNKKSITLDGQCMHGVRGIIFSANCTFHFFFFLHCHIYSVLECDLIIGFFELHSLDSKNSLYV